MTTITSQAIRRAEVVSPDPTVAVRTLAEQLHQEDQAGVLFFCSADYDSDTLAAEFRARFDCPVVGCTTAGEIGSTYQNDGIVAVSFASEQFHLHPYLIESLADFDPAEAKQMMDTIRKELTYSDDLDADGMFGLILMDGLSVMEEPVTASIHSALRGVSLVGGSAGDSLQFKETRVFANGEFHVGAGVFMLFESRLPFRTFKLQHFAPSDTDMVITEADPGSRTVTEINGGLAAEEYAELLGLKREDLTPQIFAKYPVMLQIGDEWYVRSIQKVNPDGSLTFFCAIDEGLPLTIGKSVGFVESLETKIAELETEFSKLECTLGCDCILRRLELLESGDSPRVEAALARLNFIGFSTFGEQFDSIHVNQTLTGVVLGEQ